MEKRNVKSPSLFGFWTAVGLAFGVSIGVAIGNFPIGIIAGLCLGMVLGRASYRIKGQGRLRFK